MSDKKRTLDGPQKRRRLLTVLCVVLAVILAVLVAATVYLEYLMGKIGRTQDLSQSTLSQEEIDAIQNPDETDPENSAPSVNPDDVTWADDPATHIGGDHIVNILLIGQDRREGEGRARSDSMILCTFNIEKKTLTMTSFMRDMYVPIPGYLDNRINAAYQLGGSELLDETLYENFGVEIDGNVEVDFSQFQEIIDLLGGVDVELTGEEAAYLNRRGNWDVDTASAGTWSLTQGMNHLTGEQALAYSRIRYIGNGDYGRTNRQRTVLNALIQAYKNTSLTKMLLLLDDILPLITTDMTDKEIIGYAMDLFPLLASSTVTTQRIPADGAYYNASIRGMSVLVPDLAENRQLLIDSLSPED